MKGYAGSHRHGGRTGGVAAIRTAMCTVAAFVTALLAFRLLSLRGYSSADFKTFRAAAVRLTRDPAQLYIEPGMAHRNQVAETLIGFLYPPPAAIPFAPLSAIDPGAGFFWFVTAILAAAAAALALWAWMVAKDGVTSPGIALALAIAAVALVSGPVSENWLGQIDTIVLLICIAAIGATVGGRPALGGALVAAGCWIKIYPVLLLVLLTQRIDRRRFLAGFAIAALALPFGSVAVLPVSLFVQYFGELLPAMSGRVIVNIDNQSLLASVTRAAIPMRIAIESFGAVPSSAGLRAAVNTFGIAGIAAIVWRTRGGDPLLVSAWALATVPLVAPLGWGHTYAYALPLWALVAGRSLAMRNRLVAVTMALSWLVWLPTGHHIFALGADPSAALFLVVYARMALVTLFVMAMAWALARRGARVNPIFAASL